MVFAAIPLGRSNKSPISSRNFKPSLFSSIRESKDSDIGLSGGQRR
jgi:hypothetical protein